MFIKIVRTYFKSMFFPLTLFIISVLSTFLFDWDYLGEEDKAYLVIYFYYFLYTTIFSLIILRFIKHFTWRDLMAVFSLGLAVVFFYLGWIGGVVYNEIEFLISFALAGIFISIIEAGFFRIVIDKIKKIKRERVLYPLVIDVFLMIISIIFFVLGFYLSDMEDINDSYKVSYFSFIFFMLFKISRSRFYVFLNLKKLMKRISATYLYFKIENQDLTIGLIFVENVLTNRENQVIIKNK